ncbi:hypothetical protein ACGFNV_35795 [Streptomyces sp. NPDC048751]|uniref:hypothetical protein n=1 Tax=Streptomyces sp. NPDC048751 TaxID=3365591 RepID=UPI003714CCCA
MSTVWVHAQVIQPLIQPADSTDIVNGGLPIHIGAALLGHVNLQTTQGYVAVFAEDIVKHYQEFLNHRRALRPEDEYSDVTSEEWAEFEEHFDPVTLGIPAVPSPNR